MTQTLHVIDPLLAHQGGHYLSQHTALWNLCRRMGFGMVSYTHVDFDADLMPAGVGVEKVFGASMVPDLDGHFCIDLAVSNQRCREDLKAIDPGRFGPGDILFLTSATAQHAIAYGHWLREIDAGLRCRVGIYCMISSEIDDTRGRDLRRHGIPLSNDSFAALDRVVLPNELKRSMYRYLIDSIPPGRATRYKVFYEEPFASRVFLELCDNPEVEFTYLHSMYPGEMPELHGNAPDRTPASIAYLGSGGLGGDSKGQHLVADIVEHVEQHHPSLSLVMQLGDARTGSGVAPQHEALISALGDKRNVQLQVGMLSCADYCRLIENTDLMLLPYGPRYRHIMSGIFDDCLFLGKVCVIPKQSKMALWMERHNLDFPGFTEWSAGGVITALDDALARFEFYQQQFNQAQSICQRRWQKKNPIAVFLDERP